MGFYNINFPSCSTKEVKGIKICNSGKRKKATFEMVPQSKSTERNFLWIKHNQQNSQSSKKIDEHYLDKNFITISALKTDLSWKEKNKKLIKIFS